MTPVCGLVTTSEKQFPFGEVLSWVHCEQQEEGKGGGWGRDKKGQTFILYSILTVLNLKTSTFPILTDTYKPNGPTD